MVLFLHHAHQPRCHHAPSASHTPTPLSPCSFCITHANPIDPQITTALFAHGRQLSLSQDLAVGFFAGVLNTVLTNPLWVAATRMKLRDTNGADGGRGGGGAEHRGNGSTEREMVDTRGAPRGFWSTLAEVARSGGAWKGLGAGVLLCTNPAINYGLFEQIKKGLIKMSKTRQGGTLNAGPAFLAGVVAKTVATVLTYPLQLVQVHSQKSKLPGGFVVSALVRKRSLYPTGILFSLNSITYTLLRCHDPHSWNGYPTGAHDTARSVSLGLVGSKLPTFYMC